MRLKNPFRPAAQLARSLLIVAMLQPVTIMPQQKTPQPYPDADPELRKPPPHAEPTLAPSQQEKDRRLERERRDPKQPARPTDGAAS
jgi:hypothetical protein